MNHYQILLGNSFFNKYKYSHSHPEILAEDTNYIGAFN
ncbi:hypothetical protein PPAR_a0118 [Pseudoalteromonas paragorgicola KMM 3548]|nr:hypothetical protein PH505_az00350 [Pseudoalteromonas distincta]MBE3672975.1 hypothetical protein [Pseudoalteromonas distincta KMM 3548]GAA78480.1 hypothetical protein P20495_0971 [Pseudoalteromonas sp. BSi20495]